MAKFEISIQIIERDGPFKEFKQDASIVNIKLLNSVVIENVLVIYPNIIAAIKGQSELTFECSQISSVIQTDSNLKERFKSHWIFFGL
ncbi:hypothetical protein [Colwellia sp. BRX9-1]|uniref:hypothetical protein n=1 Tax=Colwellia sp. BRX9-1 TaxID=2759830 RepID=UPI0015F5059E|nr:hypothetical protein [Colwellia sp. BRX9-1]MBA6352899.1 hypothetical protein [Colwellia sp. BRX9-1]